MRIEMYRRRSEESWTEKPHRQEDNDIFKYVFGNLTKENDATNKTENRDVLKKIVERLENTAST